MADQMRSRLARIGVALGRSSAALVAVAGVAIGASAGHPSGEIPVHPTVASAVAHLDAADAPQVPPDFTHADHEGVQCYECHDTRDSHTARVVTTIQDCRRCHHTAPTSAPCSRCHTAADAPDRSFRAVRAVAFSVGTSDPARVMSFPHDRHATIDCARCHTQGTSLAVPADLNCQGCHQDHHTAQSDCASCHRVAPVEAHPPAEAHVTCSGASCHRTVPFETVPRTRAFCLGCHQDLREHEAPRACAECHSLPAPRPQGGGLQ